MSYTYKKFPPSDCRAITGSSKLPSLEQVAAKWGRSLAEAILNEVPKRYKLDKGVVKGGVNEYYSSVLCQGTSVRDLEVEITVAYITDVYAGSVVGTATWKEVGFGTDEMELRLRADKSGDVLVDQIRKFIAQHERS